MNRVPRKSAKNWGKRWIRKAALNQLFYPDVKDAFTLSQSVLAPLEPPLRNAPMVTLIKEILQMEGIMDEFNDTFIEYLNT